jgi:hypothetical protein
LYRASPFGRGDLAAGVDVAVVVVAAEVVVGVAGASIAV